MERPDFEALVERFYQPLYRFAYSLARREAEACDLTQQTFLLWATRGHQLRDAAKAKSWLFTTLYREFLALKRQEARFTEPPESGWDESLDPIEPSLPAALDGRTVLDALARVDPVFRAALSLFYLEDYSYQEIAATLGVPIGTVMSRLSRGKQQLRRLLTAARTHAEPGVIPFARSATS